MIRQSPLVRLLLTGSHVLRLPRLGDRLSGRRLRVLMYHGVTATEDYPGVTNHYGYNLPRRLFEEHIAYLAKHCHPVSLDDVLAGRLASDRVNVLVTFDDGYENNFSSAYPVLERYGVPALFALPTGFVCGREPLWNDLIERAVVATSRSEVTIDWDGDRKHFDLGGPTSRAGLLVWLMRRAAVIDPERRGELVATACEALDVDPERPAPFDNEDYRPLEEGQIRSMAAGGLAEFASHSVSHYMMAGLPSDVKRRELEVSRQAVEELTGRRCRAFCVPGGSYDEELVSQAGEVGYEAVLTSDWGWADSAAPTLNRCGIFASYDEPRFVDEVHGPVVASLLSLRRALRGG